MSPPKHALSTEPAPIAPGPEVAAPPRPPRFPAFDGLRAIAAVTETRYGKWLRRAAGGQLGVSAIDGGPLDIAAGSIAATNGQVHREFLAVLGTVQIAKP